MAKKIILAGKMNIRYISYAFLAATLGGVFYSIFLHKPREFGDERPVQHCDVDFECPIVMSPPQKFKYK